MIQERAEFHERLDGKPGTQAMLVEHRSLGRAVAATQRTDQQAVMLIEFLQCRVCRTVKFYQSLLTSATQQGSTHGTCLVIRNRAAPDKRPGSAISG